MAGVITSITKNLTKMSFFVKLFRKKSINANYLLDIYIKKFAKME